MSKEYKKYDRLTLRKCVEHMDRLKREIDTLAEQKTALQKEYDFLRFVKVPDKMEADGVDKVTYEGIGTVYTSTDVNASVKAGQKEKAFEWLEKHKLSDLITETINSSSLRSLAKRRAIEGDPLPEAIFNVNSYTRANIKRN